MTRPRRWPEILTFLGGVGLLGAFFLPFSTKETQGGAMTPLLVVSVHLELAVRVMELDLTLREWAGACWLAVVTIVRAVPYVFGLYAALESVRRLAFQHRRAGTSLWTLRVLLTLWLLRSAGGLIAEPGSPWTPLFVFTAGAYVIGLVLWGRWWPLTMDHQRLRRALLLGSMVFAAYHASMTYLIEQPDMLSLSFALTASALVLVGSLLGWREPQVPGGEVRQEPLGALRIEAFDAGPCSGSAFTNKMDLARPLSGLSHSLAWPGT